MVSFTGSQILQSDAVLVLNASVLFKSLLLQRGQSARMKMTNCLYQTQRATVSNNIVQYLLTNMSQTLT